MNTTTRRALIAPLALTVTVAMSACASEEDSGSQGSDSTTSSADDTGDDSSDNSSNDSSADSPAPDSPAPDSGGSAGTGAPGGTTETGLKAIATAEQAVDGTAYEIDDQDDDGTWEIDVRVGDASVEVTVSADGTQMLEQENDDLDDDDKARLDAASITLSEAIQTAVAQAGGELDDAELDSDDGNQHYWEISVDTDQQDDVEVHVSVTGEVIEVDD